MIEKGKKLAIIGASGHGKVAADIAAQNGYGEIVFLDDNPERNVCGKYCVAGTSREASSFARQGYVLLVAVGRAEIRQRIQERIEAEGAECVTLVHPDAVVAEDVKLEDGTIVMAGVVINPGSRVGKGCIINTCASVDHDCRLEDYVHVSVGTHLAGTVHVGIRTWIGAGAVVSNDVDICGDCMIGAGAVVVRDIEEGGTYVGVPAKQVNYTNENTDFSK